MKKFFSTLEKPKTLNNLKNSNLQIQIFKIAKNTLHFFNSTLTVINQYSQIKDTGKLYKRNHIRNVLILKNDWLKIIPASVYLLLPFTLPTLPIILKYFPQFLPTFLNTDTTTALKLNTIKKKRINEAHVGLKSFSDYLDSINNQKSTTLKKLLEKKEIKPVEWVELHQFLKSHCSLNTIDKKVLNSLSKFIGIHVIYKKERLIKWVDWIIKDDQLIKEYGLHNLSDYELIEALEERGFATGMPLEGDQVYLRKLLQNSIDFGVGLKRLGRLDLDVLAVLFIIQRMHYIVVNGLDVGQ